MALCHTLKKEKSTNYFTKVADADVCSASALVIYHYLLKKLMYNTLSDFYENYITIHSEKFPEER